MTLMVSEWAEAPARPIDPALQAAPNWLRVCGPSLSGAMAMGRLLSLDAASYRVRPIFLPLDEPWFELRDG